VGLRSRLLRKDRNPRHEILGQITQYAVTPIRLCTQGQSLRLTDLNKALSTNLLPNSFSAKEGAL